MRCPGGHGPSVRTDRYRLNRGGNRRINRALHIVARTQSAWNPGAKAYIDKKHAAGKTHQEAMRSLKRRLSDVVYRTMLDDLHRAEAAGT